MGDEKVWRPLELIKVTAGYLAEKAVPDPRLDAEILLCEILGLPRRVDLYAGFEREISGKELTAYRELIRRRAAREPVSRILGRRDFMGLTFTVTPDVLSPRPETELLVETAIEAVRPKKPTEAVTAEPAEPTMPAVAVDGDADEALERLLDSYAEDVLDADEPEALPTPEPVPAPEPVRPATGLRAKQKVAAAPVAAAPVAALDLGTGSGCVAVALAAHLPGATVTAVDASARALAVAKRNAAAAGVSDRVTFRQGDWFAGCRPGEVFDVILSNPPYLVEGDDSIWPEVRAYDPPAALYGGKDGLDCYRRIIPDAPQWLAPDGQLFFEVGSGQAGRVADLLRGRGFRAVRVVRDYAGIERIVTGLAPG
ncbi:MAG: peptide chain release factor N(5)-glutamine methyltransferase [Planctomycetes bacterium]|nr:peptide chain release factor N(5)-glutamine methyltransferase [Planctomycetota bacterium]